MASSIFEPYLADPVTANTYKELGQKIQQLTSLEQKVLLENFQPHELHFHFLKLAVARMTGCQQPLLDGLKNECKYVSKFCVNSKLLYYGGNTLLLNPDFLMPLLQTVSSSIRNKIIWNIGKYISCGKNAKLHVADVDALYKVVSKIWGANVAVPLLCQASEELLKEELPQTVNLSNGHLLILAKRYPSMALSYLNQLTSRKSTLQKAARYIVWQTLPDSLDYIKKQNSTFLSKSAMKFILHNYLPNILENPHSWLQVLDKKVVKKNLKPDSFQLFLFKLLLEVDIIQYDLEEYIKLLSPTGCSALFNKVFQEKYGCNLQSKMEFWKRHSGLVEHLDASDRSCIAQELDAKSRPSTQWLPLMTTDLSMPIIKKLLFTEQNPQKRSRLFSSLIYSAILNKDQKAIEEICNLAVDRYRNDKGTIQVFFKSSLDFSSLSPQSFDLVLALAKKFYAPNDWQTHCAALMFAIAIKKNWSEQGLREYIDRLLNNTPHFTISDLYNIQNQFYLTFINDVFTAANIENKQKLRQLASFLPLITKWISLSSVPLITDNVKKSVLAILKLEFQGNQRITFVCQQAITFVCTHFKMLNLEFIEQCFVEFPHEKLFSYLLSRKSDILSTQESIDKLGSYLLKNGVSSFISQLRKLRKIGHLEVLQSLALLSKQAIADATVSNCTNAVILLMLTSNANDYFSVIDPLLPNNANSSSTLSAAGETTKQGRFSPFNSSKREDSIYFGFGLSLSHLPYPCMAPERLQRFCVSGDLILFVRDGLYSVCSFLPNENAKVFLLTLMNQPVSVKKHALRLLWRMVCNVETQEQLLGQLMDSEKHLSIRIILMDTALALLNLCKTDSLWDVVRTMILKLGPDDQTIITSLLVKKVPDPFLEEYFQILLDKCKALQNVDNLENISNLLNMLCCNVSLMSEKFIESIISEFFFAEVFFEGAHYYNCVLQLFIEYLYGVPASNLPNGKVVVCKDLESRKQFLKERLDTCVVDGPLDVFSTVVGGYPVRRLLMMFVSSFCRNCLNSLDKPKAYPLTDYIDFLLSYFNHFNQNAVFCPHVLLSLTKICAENVSASAVVVGKNIGEFSDGVLLKHSTAVLGFYPQVVKRFINYFLLHSPSFQNVTLIDIMNGMLIQPGGFGDLLLRPMIVAHMLPSHWLTDEEYNDFRETFLVLIKNTPIEVFLFSLNF